MIVEMRTYTLRPGTLVEVEKRFAEGLTGRESTPSSPPSGTPRSAR
jgi:hypothetical protein